MKVVIFGDVHGNLIALEKLFNIEKDNFDLFICHGDIVNYGPWSNECINILTEMSDGTLLMGNHEKYFINGIYDGTNKIAKAFFEHCYSYFNKSLINDIKSYKCQTSLNNFIVKHTIFDQYIFADTDISKLEIISDFIIGHSHQQFEREKGDYKIINTGSLGQNREYINQSSYIIFDTKSGKVELKHFIHDIYQMINQMKSEKYPKICIDYYMSKKKL